MNLHRLLEALMFKIVSHQLTSKPWTLQTPSSKCLPKAMGNDQKPPKQGVWDSIREVLVPIIWIMGENKMIKFYCILWAYYNYTTIYLAWNGRILQAMLCHPTAKPLHDPAHSGALFSVFKAQKGQYN